MLKPSSALALAMITPLIAGSAAAQPPPPVAGSAAAQPPPMMAPPPGYYPAPPYRPMYAPPYAALPAYPTTELYSPAMLISGIALHVVGTFAAIFGTIAYQGNAFTCFDCGGGQHGVDTFVMVAGGVGMLAGIPLIVIGARRVRVMPQDASLVPMMTPSLRGGALTFRF